MKLVGCIQGRGDILYHIEQCNLHADFIEFRLDLIARKDYLQLFPLCKKPIIATLRSKEQGGWFSGEHQARMNVLKEAITHGATFVDMEIAHHEPLSNAKGIASFHGNFMQAKEVIKQCTTIGATHIKICVASASVEQLEQLREQYNHPTALLTCFSLEQPQSRYHVKNNLLYCTPEKGFETAPHQPLLQQVREQSNSSITKQFAPTTPSKKGP